MKLADTSSQDEVLATSNSMHRRWLIATGVIMTFVAMFYLLSPAVAKWSQTDRSIPLKRVRLASVEITDFVRDVSVQGRVVAAVSPTLYAPAEGTITFAIDAGSEVKQGDILAEIDSPELTSRFDQEQASLQNLQTGLKRQTIQSKKQQLFDKKAVDLAQVALTTATREKRRADQAYSKHAISQIDFEKAQDDLANAKLQFDHAVSDAQLAKESMDFDLQSLRLDIQRQTLLVNDLQRQVNALKVASPVNGIVGNLNVENKTYLAKNQAILMVVDLSQFEVEVAVPESYADDLLLGMDVEVQFSQQPYRARLVTISPEILDNQVTGRVRFEEQVPRGLRQNQRLNTRILLERRDDVLQVRRGQFLDSSNGRFAYVVKDGIAIKRPIKTGARSLSKVEIVEGLTIGDQIVISGTDIFENAEQVMLTQ
ncbi:HlyD family efflux transporter periplasmic adaptor subunit [Thalassotalea sp. HSM 43]|uniref:efflux RND transporter periplasmic adaptor subunit n=1 Tax=Thalassotalea sp. HSM 43 TaxID=2552945 RepID=UPI0010818603|nr:efflux RND transporter periplasmic adaptor subunit [Thalassotalea sp. HSM 43]QBY05385.1 HlyD family efflux transporter periplasmic adaptor subunit [Thalassotalea sp. HSM 43]